ncbi:MAG TPA: nickel transporter [Burkholderiales bacterium]|nr:nickel transporter [Burkholderiales bacterium]
MGTAVSPEIALAALVFVLGLKHGLDPDHLVAIDGLARSTRSRWTGLFFSLGHGIVVTLVGVALALAAADWQLPPWLEQFGAAVSISVLLALGAANLAMSIRTRRGEPVPTVGIRGRWLVERLGGASHPIVVAAIGAAFALSFDTLSHALLFSASGATAAGWAFAAALGLVFTSGMVLTDALNGWWVASLIGSTDARAARASRLMSLTVAGLCFVIAAIGLAKLVHPALDETAGAAAPFIGLGTLGVVMSAWLVARCMNRRARIAFRI